MRKLTMLFCLLNLFANIGFCQEVKKDTRSQLMKDDDMNEYNSELVSNLDLIESLELAGIRNFKFKLAEFDKKYNILLTVDEFESGKLVKSDTLMDESNEYDYYEVHGTTYFVDYFDQIKIFTKEGQNKLTLQIKTYSMSLNKVLSYKYIDENQYFNLRRYKNTAWQINKKIPLLVYASSWKDERGNERFCGAVNMVENEKFTERIISSSPHYFLISYKVSDFLQ